MPGPRARNMKDEEVGFLLVGELIEIDGKRWYLCTCQKGGCGNTRLLPQAALIRKQVRQCKKCGAAATRENHKKYGRAVDTGGLKKRQLTDEQREVFDAMMAGRRKTAEATDEALGMVARATQRGTLAEELEYWTTPIVFETRKQSSLAVAMTSR